MFNQEDQQQEAVQEPKIALKWVVLGSILLVLFLGGKVAEWQIGRSFTKLVKSIAGEQSIQKISVSVFTLNPKIYGYKVDVSKDETRLKAEKVMVQVPYSTFLGLKDVATKRDLKVYPPIGFTINLHQFSVLEAGLTIATMQEGILYWSGKMDDLANILQKPFNTTPWSFNLSIKNVSLNPRSLNELLDLDIPPYMLGQNYHFQIEWAPALRKLSLKKLDWNSGDYVASIHGELTYDSFSDDRVPRNGTLFYKMRGKYRLDNLSSFNLPITVIEIDQVDLFGALAVDQGEWKPTGRTQWEINRFRMRYTDEFKTLFGMFSGLAGFGTDVMEIDQFKLLANISLSRMELEKMDLVTRGFTLNAEASIDLKDAFMESIIRKSKLRLAPKSDQVRAGVEFLQNLTGTQFQLRNDVYSFELEGKLNAPKVKAN